MSRLTALIEEAAEGLSIQQSIPEARWDAIARECGAAEIAEIKARTVALRAEWDTVEEWDGDAQDDVHFWIWRFSRLLALAEGASAPAS